MCKISFSIFFILFSGLLFSQNLSCTISAEKLAIKKGEVPAISIEIKNNTDSVIYLVKSLDASKLQWRYPYAYFTVEKIGDKDYKLEEYSRCGNYDEIDTSDFVEVKKGESFDPYKGQSRLYKDHRVSYSGNFKQKGKYLIKFYYSTNQYDIKKWMGDQYAGQVRFWFDEKTGIIKPEFKAEYEKILILFSKVPKIDLVSNELIIEVR